MLRCSWPPTSTANNNTNGRGLQCWWWWLPSFLSLTGHGTALSFSKVALPLSHTHRGTCAVQPALQTGFEGGNWPAWALRWLCWYIPTADALGQRQSERAPVFFVSWFVSTFGADGWSVGTLSKAQLKKTNQSLYLFNFCFQLIINCRKIQNKCKWMHTKWN